MLRCLKYYESDTAHCRHISKHYECDPFCNSNRRNRVQSCTYCPVVTDFRTPRQRFGQC